MRITALIVVVILVTLGVLVVGAKWAERMERNTQARRLVLDIVEQHVAATCEWPESWEQLHQYRPLIRTIYIWPRDSHRVKERVSLIHAMHVSEIELTHNGIEELIISESPYSECIGLENSLIDSLASCRSNPEK